MKEGRKPGYPEKTPGDELQKMPHIFQTLPCPASDVVGSVLELVRPVSVYFGLVR